MIKTLTDRSFYMDLLQTIRRSGLSVRASSLAYSLLMASIPLLLIFLQLASLFLNNPQLALDGVWNILPTQVAQVFQEVIRVLAESLSTTSLGLGIFSALWLGSNGINKLILSVNRSLGFDLRSNGPVRRILAIIYTVLFIFSLIILLLFLVYSRNIGGILESLAKTFMVEEALAPFIRIFESLLARLLPPAGFILILILFYKTAPMASKGTIQWREAALGGIFTGLAILIVTVVYAFIMDNISSLPIYYGSLAGILGLMVWLLYISFILVGGAEVIASYRKIRKE
ncbi:MAG: YhjD/YihY/BrkB family envelope integrity protein [Firmicutes bacterium]|nr:YhjD/YihY/BrkB family envelope integrity protein [Bacillota bacterium]